MLSCFYRISSNALDGAIAHALVSVVPNAEDIATAIGYFPTIRVQRVRRLSLTRAALLSSHRVRMMMMMSRVCQISGEQHKRENRQEAATPTGTRIGWNI